VLAVPHWFTEAQRRGVAQACEIAGMNSLKIANEGTNVALSYGIFKSAKKLFSETDPVHVMFIDIGYTGMSVSVVDFIQVGRLNSKLQSFVANCAMQCKPLHRLLPIIYRLSFYHYAALTGEHEGALGGVRPPYRRPQLRRRDHRVPGRDLPEEDW
jgi:hypothetical protein